MSPEGVPCHQSHHASTKLIYIVTPDASDQDVAGVHAEVESIVARFNGQIENTEHWGKRRLAYVIGDHKEGTYVLELIRGSGDLVKEARSPASRIRSCPPPPRGTRR